MEGPKNAFAVLTSSAKRKRPFQGQTELDQPSSYRTCPLCAKSFPRALIQNHADSCKGASALLPVQSPEASDTGELQPVISKASGSSGTQQSDQGSDATAANSQQPPSAAANAFSYLMAEQREQSQIMVFFLEQTQDKTWQTYWWTKGPKTSTRLPAQTNSESADTASAAPTSVKTPHSKAVWSTTTQILSSVLHSPTATSPGSAKSKVTVQLQTNVAPGSEGDLARMTQTAPGAYKGSPPLLKSALQKNVRLCRAAAAVRCALQLMKDNAGEFLRRISIICLEDAILHPEMPLLVWLMCAQAKRYTMGVAAASACLQIVYQLACMPVRDCYPFDPASLSTEAGASSVLNDEEALLVRCIAIRAAYGGMAGDVAMLRDFASLWTTRFLAGATCLFSFHLRKQVHGTNNNTASDQQSLAGCTWLAYLQQFYSSIPSPPGGIAGLALVPLRFRCHRKTGIAASMARYTCSSRCLVHELHTATVQLTRAVC
ncbi:hypothetical protein ABBQ38_007132 [Trebouxia sp. C0009 RCD-2024]